MDKKWDFRLRVAAVGLAAAAGVAALRADYGTGASFIDDMARVLGEAKDEVKAWILTPTDAERERLERKRKG